MVKINECCLDFDLGTKRQWQNAIAQNPNAENARVNPKTPTPKHKKISGISYIGILSVAFRPDTLDFN